MAKSSMEFPGRENEIKKQSPHSIEGLVESGFIDECGRLTWRACRALPRGGVNKLVPTQIQEYEEDASQYVQGGYKLEDGTLWRSCFRVPRRFAYDNYRLTPLAEHSGQRFKQGYIVVCQDPTLVDIMDGTTQERKL